ncbi:MAG: prepilin-type N-terminal cleavage/methylation domain-containing protein [Deltaproteobacteria bacterium]|jgi:prepilin-type N-terminal cleavage/methylation domain-containing protein|nr:prepilin-type N-terminal cleavage/methylation domain-containing protein [Deltaproteobacteria bacterium]
MSKAKGGIQRNDTPGLGQGRPGFTLIEIIVTVLIISIGCLAALVMQSNALKSNTLSDSMTVGTFLAESEVERLQALSYSHLEAEVNSLSDKKVTKYFNRKSEPCPGTSAAACGDYPYIMQVNFFPQLPTSKSYQADIEVTWRDNVGRNSVFYSAIFTDLDFK